MNSIEGLLYICTTLLLLINVIVFFPGVPAAVAGQYLRIFYAWPQRDSLSTSRLIRVHVCCNGAALALAMSGSAHRAAYIILVTIGSLSAILYSRIYHAHDNAVRAAFGFMALSVTGPALLLHDTTVSQAALFGSFLVFRLNAITLVKWAGAKRTAKLLNIYCSCLVGPIVLQLVI